MLFQYRITPHSTTDVSLSELLYGRRIKSHLDLIQLDLASHVKAKQMDQKKYHDCHSRHWIFEVQVGDTVFVRNLGSGGQTWLPGQIQETQGPVSYSVLLSDGHSVKRHIDYLRKRTIDVTTDPSENGGDDYLPPLPMGNDSSNVVPDATAPVQCSSRIKRPPDHYTTGTGHQWHSI